MFKKGTKYCVRKSDSKYDDIEGVYVRTLKNQNGVRFAEIKKFVINPVEAREASLDMPETLTAKYDMPEDVSTDYYASLLG